MRKSLRQKAFAFFFAFEVCMLAIFGLLLFLLHQAEAESRREEHAKHIIGRTQQLGLMFQKAGASVANYCRTKDPSLLADYDYCHSQLPVVCKELREELQDTPEQLPVFDRIERSATHIDGVLSKVRRVIENMTQIEALQLMMAARDKEQKDLDGLVQDALEMVQAQQKIADESPIRERHNRQIYRWLLAGGFVATTAMALLGLAGFLKQVIFRLRVMEDNTRKLARNEELNPLLRGDDEIAHLDSVFHDVARALKEAQEAERELQQMRKAFVAMVSHDLRTPLTSVHGFLELLEMGALGEISDKAREHTERTMSSVERLIKLINDLLDLEKMESGTINLHAKEMNLRKVIEMSLDSVRVLAATQQVKLAYQPADVNITADPDRLAQVVINLLSNAIKFSPQQGTVTVRVDDGPQWVEVCVKDEGRGVPPKYQAIIFERFRQVEEADHSKKGGTGLGLPICKAMIEQHGGSIGVRSEEGKGSEFWFKLPKQAVTAAEAPQAVAASGA